MDIIVSNFQNKHIDIAKLLLYAIQGYNERVFRENSKKYVESLKPS